MGWTAYYQILRDRPLDDTELAALDDHITRSNRPPWECEGFGLVVTKVARLDRVLGEGWTKLPMDLDDSTDHQRLCDALEAMRAIVPGVEIRISDDFQSFGFADDKVALGGKRGPALVDLSSADRATLVPPSSLLPPRHVPVPAAVLDGDDVQVALLELARMETEHPDYERLKARVAAATPLALVHAGFAEYREVSRRSDAWRLVETALAALTDVRPIVDDFLKVWCNPHGIYWYGDMSLPEATRDALAEQREVETQMRADLAASLEGSESELTHRRAEHAAAMLGRARTPSALITLVESARILRGRTMSTNERYHTSVGIQRGLINAGGAAVVPTLLLGFDGANGLGNHHRAALGVLARLAPARVAPILRQLASTGEALWEVIPALQIAGDTATLRSLCEFPIENERARAAEALRALGESPPLLDAPPPPETLVTHVSPVVRTHALNELERTNDPAILTSVVAVHVLEAAIGRRFGGATGSYGSYFQLLPDDLRYASHAKQLRALVSGQVTNLPEQIIWPTVQPILDGDVDKLAEGYPPPTLHFDAATLDTLRDEEARALDALRGGRVVPDLGTAPVALATTAAAAPSIAIPATPAAAAATPAPLPRADAPVPHESTPSDAIIDALLETLAHETQPTEDLVSRTGLSRSVLTMDRWDREKVICDRLVELGRIAVGQRLLARLPELHNGSGLGTLCDLVFPQVATVPDGARRLGEAWDEAFTLPWDSPSRAESCFKSVAAQASLFERAVDEIAAPDNGAFNRRTTGAFELLAAANDRRADATAVIVARVRADRGRPNNIVGWRGDAYRALRTGGAEAVATAVLELAELASVGRVSALLEVLARSERGLALLAQAIDLPELSSDAVKELLRADRSDDLRARYLAHPYWKVRTAAADANSDWGRSRVEMFAAWATIDASGIAVREDDRRYARPGDAPADASWDDLARQYGKPITLPPLPPARDGLGSVCADYRAWALWAVDEQCNPDDVVARVFGDELDAALVAYGHVRNAARWPRWRASVPDVPLTRRARTAWARERAGAPLPAALIRVRDEGADAVAATFPRPHLTLSSELRAELEAIERPLAERGAHLLRHGL